MGAALALRGDLEGPQTLSGGTVRDEPARWQALADGTGCPICRDGEPLDVLVERGASWITSGDRVPVAGYVCVSSTRHFVEPYQLPPFECGACWDDVLFAAERVARILEPIKPNYEIHGNTLPHLHVQVFPCFRGDRFIGGAIDPRGEPVLQSPDQLARLRAALTIR